MQALRKCESIALNLGVQVDNCVNLNLKYINQLNVLLCLVLWHINYFRLSNVKSFFYISSSSSSSSRRAGSTDIPDPLSPLFPIIHRLRQVFWTTSRILTLLLNVCSCWSSCFCTAMCVSPQEYITYELVPASPAVSYMSGSSNLNSFRDRRQVAVQLVSSARTCSRLLAAFLCNCRLASSPAVLLESI